MQAGRDNNLKCKSLKMGVPLGGMFEGEGCDLVLVTLLFVIGFG